MHHKTNTETRMAVYIYIYISIFLQKLSKLSSICGGTNNINIDIKNRIDLGITNYLKQIISYKSLSFLRALEVIVVKDKYV